MITGIIYRYISPSGKSYIGQTIDEIVRKQFFYNLNCSYGGKKIDNARLLKLQGLIVLILENVVMVEEKVLVIIYGNLYKKKENMERKELSRFELAIVKRTAQNTKSLRTKRDKLVEKIEKAQEELTTINEAIEGFEAPIKTMTGGFTSEEVLTGIMAVAEATEAAPEGEVSEEAVGEVEVPASEAVALAEEVTEAPENIGTANPFGEVADEMPFKD